jgi:hypothetical protein
MKANATKVAHYQHVSGFEPIDAAQLMSFNLGNALKYVCRRNAKHETPFDDLQKAIDYLKRERKLRQTSQAMFILARHRETIRQVCYALAENEPPNIRTAIHSIALAAMQPDDLRKHIGMAIASLEIELDAVIQNKEKRMA